MKKTKAETKAEKREGKKKKKMVVSGKSVFKLKEIIIHPHTNSKKTKR
jgi:hypothetical protein